MITIEIKPEEVEQAKKQIIKFDAQKTHDKFVCKTNYIGPLGEIVFHRYLTEQKIDHEWVSFVKQGWNEPDFIMNGATYDLKTTYSNSMWYQQPKFDVYIYSRISQDDKFLVVTSWMTKEQLEAAKTSGKAKAVTRGNRVDYVIEPDSMLSIDWLAVVHPPPQQPPIQKERHTIIMTGDEFTALLERSENK